jgi:murein DD-endopeptidase MepM/ murein hydrolase activator NlpD
MPNWRRIAGILVLSHLSFGALLLTATAEATAVAIAAEIGHEITPVIQLITPEPTKEATIAPADSPPGAVDWANVELLEGRQSYLTTGSPAGEEAAESRPLPAPQMPAPMMVEPVPTPAAAAVSAPASSEPLLYIVQAGDNLFRIAWRHNVALEQLATINQIGDPSRLSVGQQLLIPDGSNTPPAASGILSPAPDDGLYVVQVGDSPYQIARRFGIPLESFLALNNISDPRRLRPGQVLRVTGHATTLPATVEVTPSPAATVAVTPSPAATVAVTAGTHTIYVIQGGDIPYNIARRFGISVEALLAANQITDPRRLQIGQELIIPEAGATAPAVSVPAAPANLPPFATPQVPPPAAASYTVQQGDIPVRIAGRYGISVNALLTANSITDPTRLRIGQVLLIPTPAAPLPLPTSSTADNASGSTFLVWPVDSRSISQRYRYGHGAIDLRTPVGSTVWAAAAGTVEFAGWNNQGYGYLVVIDHGNGFRTLYAHNSSINVKVGQEVAQSELIALSGNTGRSSGPHLHLEILLDYRPVNPCLYLPGGC